MGCAVKRCLQVALAVSLLSLAGCETFDPTSILEADIFNTKKKLPGDRQPVFPDGTPGVSQGVPPEMVKGYQPPPEPEPPKAAEAKPKPKPKPIVRPKEPPREPQPATAAARPAPAPASQQTQWPDPPAQRPAGGASWPGSSAPSGQVAWPDPPSQR